MLSPMFFDSFIINGLRSDLMPFEILEILSIRTFASWFIKIKKSF